MLKIYRAFTSGYSVAATPYLTVPIDIILLGFHDKITNFGINSIFIPRIGRICLHIIKTGCI